MTKVHLHLPKANCKCSDARPTSILGWNCQVSVYAYFSRLCSPLKSVLYSATGPSLVVNVFLLDVVVLVVVIVAIIVAVVVVVVAVAAAV